MTTQQAPTEPTVEPGDRVLITQTVEPDGFDDEYPTDGQHAELVAIVPDWGYDVRLDNGDTATVHAVRATGETWAAYERDVARHALVQARAEVRRLEKDRDEYQRIALDLGHYLTRFDVPDAVRTALRKIRYGDDA